MRVLLALVAVLFSVGAMAADDLAELKNRLDKIETVRGDFTQTIVSKDGELVQRSAGSFAIKRPGHFLWVSTEPFAQTLIGSPEKLWIYDPDLEQLTIRRQTLNDAGSPAKILSGDVSDLHNSFAVKRSAHDDQVTFDLLPVAADEANYKSISITFEKQQLYSVRFADKLEQTTHVAFAGVKTNHPLDPAVFEFSPPPGTDIISDEQ